jgi:predicted NBD/HSP70 family sugar kinase/biotin operon repressor
MIPAACPISKLFAEDRQLLQHLHQGAKSRAQVAEDLGLSRNTVATRLQRLIDAGWVIETEDAPKDRGRPVQLYGLNPLALLIFAVSFDSIRVTAAITALTGEVLVSESRPVASELDPEAAVAVMETLMAAMTTQKGIRRDRLGIAVVSAKGPVRERARTIAWSRVGVLPIDLSQRLGLPTLVENDANLMALGAARGLDRESVLFVLVQNGIGGGLVLEGRLHRGQAGWAGEIGHIPVAAAEGIACTCGSTGCVANIADTQALIRALNRPDRPMTSDADLAASVLARDVDTLRALRQAGRHLGEALTPLVIGLAPSQVVIGGPIISLGEHYVTGVREALSSRTPPAISSQIQVTTTGAHQELSLAGSTRLALDWLFGPRPAAAS